MFKDNLLFTQQRINSFLENQLAQLPKNNLLVEAMKYSLLLGGKRIRPYLVYSVGEMLSVQKQKLDYAAAAIESIHTFSLIHDDLPAMDNDTLRRGKPTCHIKFDEATAILAGDALQAFAFELLTLSSLKPIQLKLQISSLAKATGANGICLGQNLDLSSINIDNIDDLIKIHKFKTSALIKSAIELAFYASHNYEDQNLLNKLQQYAEYIGLAFQIQDDILDVIGDSNITGKTTGIDILNQRSTYVSILGLDNAKAKLHELYQRSFELLKSINLETTPLQELALYIIKRDH